MGRTDASITNGSGDYVIAFSTTESLKRKGGADSHESVELANNAMCPLFQAVAEVTEGAICNSLVQADDVAGRRGSVKALPIEEVKSLLGRGAHRTD